MNTTSWSKRSAALLASGIAVIAVLGPTAEAGQTGPVPLTVSTTIATPCTATSGAALSFPNYTSGQAAAVNAMMGIAITCPTSSMFSPMPVNLQFAPTAPATAFEMSQGGSGAAPFLPYKLCDTSCSTGTVYGVNTAGPTVNVTSGSTAQVYELYGQIAGGLTPAVSALGYKQVVNGVVNF